MKYPIEAYPKHDGAMTSNGNIFGLTYPFWEEHTGGFLQQGPATLVISDAIPLIMMLL